MITDPFTLGLERVMMFIVGAVFLGGGLHFVKQSFDAAKNPLQCALFALIGVGVGLWLCLWAITGIPDGIPDF